MNEHVRRELEPPAMTLSRGSIGPDVKSLQEWLCLHGFHTAVDGDFGPATEAALKAFQHDHGYNTGEETKAPGVVGMQTWGVLTEPMRRAEMWKPHKAASAGHNIVDCARAHLAAQPREVGGPNAGPWVRYYARGQEVPWCAGFVGTVLEQALGHDEWYTLSCDELAAKAADRGVFGLAPVNAAERAMIKPGDIFLLRSPGLSMVDWVHTGIVTAVGAGYFETVEGNTNTNGAREGTAVHARVRAFKPNVDFVLTGGG